jgi:hypothetical protein
MDKVDFEEWSQNFKKSPTGGEALLFLDDNIEDPHGYLRGWILKSCYNAVSFKDTSREKRGREKERERDIIEEINGKGRSQVKAIQMLRKFIKKYPDAANYAMNIALDSVYLSYGVIIKEGIEKNPIHITFDNILAAYEFGLKRYVPPKNNIIYWSHVGCLDFPEPAVREPKSVVLDGLIFELAFLIRKYLEGSGMVIDPGMSLPHGSRFDAQNQIIAKFVNATLDTDIIDETKVKERLNWLIKKGATLVGWDFGES